MKIIKWQGKEIKYQDHADLDMVTKTSMLLLRDSFSPSFPRLKVRISKNVNFLNLHFSIALMGYRFRV